MTRRLVFLVTVAWLGIAAVAHATDTTAPAAITNLSVIASGPHSVALTWTATGDDGTTGTATSYQLVYSSAPIDAYNIQYATVIPTYQPQASGSTECRATQALSPGMPYYFAVRAFDEASNVSPVSNNASATTPSSGWDVECE